MSPVEQADVQGNILCGYGSTWAHGCYLFLRVESPAAARAWLAGLDVQTAAPWSRPPPHAINVAFTHAALSALEVEDLDGFSTQFADGMEARAERLGDTPDEWCWHGLHVLVTVMSRDRDEVSRTVARLRASLDGLSYVDHVEAAYLPDGREPFGFRDGLSQPAIRDRNAGPYRYGKHNPEVEPGEFVLGYADESGSEPTAHPLLRNGSYMVVRRLEQDVAGFWDWIAEEAGPDRGRQEWLAARLFGRWRDGTPLALSSGRPLPGHAADRAWANRFDYADDPRGLRCPLGAHVRRMNPRAAFDGDARFSSPHRLIRRGMPYPATDGVNPGLMFVCFQADLRRQFEFVQAEWMNDGNAFGLGDDADVVSPVADGAKLVVQGAPPTLVPLRRFVKTLGGDYFFAPGLRALRLICG